MRRCKVCGEVKPLDAFYVRKPSTGCLTTQCKPCYIRLGSEKRKRLRPNCTCATCGCDFYREPSNQREQTYCSIACRDFSGPKNPKWRGGRITEKSTGRVMVYAPNHPGARLNGGKYIYEYRLVAEQIVGRPLTEDEIVHHINGDCTDNRLENLQVMSQSEHASIHFSKGGQVEVDM